MPQLGAIAAGIGIASSLAGIGGTIVSQVNKPKPPTPNVLGPANGGNTLAPPPEMPIASLSGNGLGGQPSNQMFDNLTS